MIDSAILDHVYDRLGADSAQLDASRRMAFLQELLALLRELTSTDGRDALSRLTALYTRHGLRAPDPHRGPSTDAAPSLLQERGDHRRTPLGTGAAWSDAGAAWDRWKSLERRIRAALPPPEAARVWPDARSPAEVLVGKEFLVEVQILGRPGGGGDPHGLSVTPTPAGRIEVRVHVVLDEGMEAMSPQEALALTEPGKDSAVVGFRVVATRPGSHRIRVVFDAGAASTQLSLQVAGQVTVIEAPTQVEKTGTIVIVEHPPGVIQLKVLKIARGDGTLDLRLTLIDNGRTREQTSVSVRRDHIAEIQSALTRQGERMDETAREAWRLLAEAEGRHLARILLAGLAPVLKSYPEGTSLHVECTEADMPLELALLNGNGRTQFVGERFAISRGFFDTPLGSGPLGGRAVLVSDSQAGFNLADERAGLTAMAGRLTEVIGFRAALALAAEASAYGFVHFAVHGDADPTTPGSQVLKFADGALFPRHLPTTSNSLAGALVFLNACRSGAARAMLDPEGGFFHAFGRAGAAAVVAPLWSVVSTVAGQMASDVYAALAKGTSLPEAIRRARCATGAHPDRLAYVAYCRPGCSVAG